MKTLLIALALGRQDAAPVEKKVDLEKLKVFVFDRARGLSLKVHEDGKTDLSVLEEDKESGTRAAKSWSAGSPEEFARRNPEIVRKYGLAGHLGASGGTGLAQDSFDRWWEELKKQRIPMIPDPPRFRGLEGDLDKWLEDQRKEMEELRRRFRRPGADPVPPLPEPVPAPGGREFGVRVDTVGETLREQLSLKEGEGVVVSEVKPGSVAEKAGIRKFDLFLKVDGKAVSDKWQFRTDVVDALGKPEFDLELIRAGKRETLKVKP